jgi:hypothetical protein
MADGWLGSPTVSGALCGVCVKELVGAGQRACPGREVLRPPPLSPTQGVEPAPRRSRSAAQTHKCVCCRKGASDKDLEGFGRVHAGPPAPTRKSLSLCSNRQEERPIACLMGPRCTANVARFYLLVPLASAVVGAGRRPMLRGARPLRRFGPRPAAAERPLGCTGVR